MITLSEKQAWLTIAEAFATPRGERTKGQKNLCTHGLCMATSTLWDFSLISERVIDDMDDALMSLPVGEYVPGTGYWLPTQYPGCAAGGTYRHDKLRADFCYMQYYMLGGE